MAQNQWITGRLKEMRRSKSGLAQAMSVDPARISEIIGGRRNVQLAELPAMADYLGLARDELLLRLTGGAGAPSGPLPADTPPSPLLPSSPPAEGFPILPVEVGGARPVRDLPVFGSAMGGSDGAFEMNGQIVEFIERPPALSGSRNAYGLYVQGDSMSPRFEAGWLVHVNPNRPVRRRDNVVVQVRPVDAQSPPLAYLKCFEARTATRLIVSQFNPRAELSWPLEIVVSVHRVVGIAEM